MSVGAIQAKSTKGRVWSTGWGAIRTNWRSGTPLTTMWVGILVKCLPPTMSTEPRTSRITILRTWPASRALAARSLTAWCPGFPASGFLDLVPEARRNRRSERAPRSSSTQCSTHSLRAGPNPRSMGAQEALRLTHPVGGSNPVPCEEAVSDSNTTRILARGAAPGRRCGCHSRSVLFRWNRRPGAQSYHWATLDVSGSPPTFSVHDIAHHSAPTFLTRDARLHTAQPFLVRDYLD